MNAPKTGAEMIAAERQRQIEKEGWTPEHDDEHDDSSLLLAAICYAAPVRIYVRDDYAQSIEFRDPWPKSWSEGWDKRGSYGDAYERGNGIASPDSYTHKERIDLLTKAGALIAAEIDRLQRATGVPAQYTDPAGRADWVGKPGASLPHESPSGGKGEAAGTTRQTGETPVTTISGVEGKTNG